MKVMMVMLPNKEKFVCKCSCYVFTRLPKRRYECLMCNTTYQGTKRGSKYHD
jgi:hypothetical protein